MSSDLHWTYVQRTGHVYDPDGKLFALGYSGHGEGLNNPAWQDHVGVGPLPVGFYTIGPPHTPIDHLGPLAFPLVPNRSNEMFGRSAFFIHGDNSLLNHSASNGCIILAHGFRTDIGASAVKLLRVVAEESDFAAQEESMQ